MKQLGLKARSAAWMLVCVVGGLVQPLAAPAAVQPGLLRQISGDSPFTDCTADAPTSQQGTVYDATEVEPWVVVNPTNPLNIVASWQQDRWSNGGSRGLVAGVSFDGGGSWQPVVLPGLSRCSGGLFRRVSDPWLSFAPDGTLHHIALALTPGPGQVSAMLASRSLDGGLSWSAPERVVQDSLPFFNDKEVILADPVHGDHVYAVWGRLNFGRFRGPAYFSRSTNAGQIWSTPMNLHDPGRFNQVLGVQLLAPPDGSLLMMFTEIFHVSGQRVTLLSYKRSTDQGQQWQPRSPGAYRPLQTHMMAARDPERGLDVRDGALLFDVAVDPVRGFLYAVWQDGQSTGFQWPVIFFSMSRDGGDTWSAPTRINRTPQTGETLNRQAFLPSVHVAGNGMVGVSYYDFRYNDDGPEAAADHWFTWCHPLARDCSRGTRWDHEVRISEDSFDMLLAPYANGLFMGDYVGLTATEDAFLLVYTQPHETDLASAFFRRLNIEDVVEPRGAGFWGHQLRAAVEGKGRGQESAARLQAYLADIRALHEAYAPVSSLGSLAALLQPPRPAGMRDRAQREVAALLLNLASGRLSPYAAVEGAGDVATAAVHLLEAVFDPDAPRQALAAARDRAANLNDGLLTW